MGKAKATPEVVKETAPEAPAIPPVIPEGEEKATPEGAGIPAETTPATIKQLVASTSLLAPVDVLVAPQRIDPVAKQVKTGQAIEIPAGGAVLFTLAERMTKSPIRLVETFILNQTDALVKQEITLLVDNIGLDGFFLKKGTVIAHATVVFPGV